MTINKEEIIRRIKELKIKRNAVILAHNYQIGEVQDIADYVGDSLGLSQKAAQVEEQVIVFCGVYFMAETAAVLAPEKTVLIPEKRARCPMAAMISASDLREWKKKYDQKEVVSYVNTTADVKAESDICITSSNVLRVVNSLDGQVILFAPDKNLGAYVAGQTDKKIMSWDGYCYVHNNINARHIKDKKRAYPEAEVWAHPECRPEVIDLADKVLSTGGMVREARETSKEEIMVATETGIIHRLKKENPGKKFYAAKDFAVCANMKKINLMKVLLSLEKMIYKVTVAPQIRDKAKGAIEKMVRL